MIPKPESLGQQGDFFGGHIAAIVGSITLGVVMYTGLLQFRQSERYFARQFFLSGIEQINNAVRDQDSFRAARLFDYFSRVALSSDDTEVFLILDAAVTPSLENMIRLEISSHADDNWFAPLALERISSIRLDTYIGLQGY